MAPSTRSATSSPAKRTANSNPKPAISHQRDPMKHFILPKTLSTDARFLLLPHPRLSSPQRFLFCPDQGLFQFTKVSAPSTDPRSLLFSSPQSETDNIDRQGKISSGYMSKYADILVATPFDVTFLLLAVILPHTIKSSKALFQPLDDIFEEYAQEDKHLKHLLVHGHHFVQEAMAGFCDTIEAGDERMYRPSEDKCLNMILRKVDMAIRASLPTSLEEKFVKRKLELPVLSVKREGMNTVANTGDSSRADTPSESFDSQSSAMSSTPSLVFSYTSATSSATSIGPDAVSKELHDLQKQSVVLDFILSSYVPLPVADRLRERLNSQQSPLDFGPLKEHLNTIASMKADAAAARSIGDFSRKRGLDEEESLDFREEKRRKQEEEDKRKKAGESRGVRDLKKVNVSGMKKMSDFFAKKPPSKVSA